jgi:arginase
MTEWTMIGVPSSAGAHHGGLELAPAALRKAGLVDRLIGAGVSITDAGDLPGAAFAVDREHPASRNLAAVIRVARQVADAVADVARGGSRPLVVGGDCTITLGVVAGMARVNPGVGLAYVDGEADLGSAQTGDSPGILDAAGIAHLLGLANAAPGLAGLDGPPPLLAPSRLALIGSDPREMTADQRQLIADPFLGRAVPSGRWSSTSTPTSSIRLTCRSATSRTTPRASFSSMPFAACGYCWPIRRAYASC